MQSSNENTIKEERRLAHILNEYKAQRKKGIINKDIEDLYQKYQIVDYLDDEMSELRKHESIVNFIIKYGRAPKQ